MAIRDGRTGRLTRRLALPRPASETGHDGHSMSEHPTAIAYPTVTVEPAAGGLAEDALGKQELVALMRFYAETYH